MDLLLAAVLVVSNAVWWWFERKLKRESTHYYSLAAIGSNALQLLNERYLSVIEQEVGRSETLIISNQVLSDIEQELVDYMHLKYGVDIEYVKLALRRP